MPEVDTTPSTHAPAPAAPRKRGRPPKAKGAGDAADSGRRQALIAAAARYFRDKGFDATTTRDIASATGMQSGSPFYHFKSKHELLFAIMEAGMQSAQRSQQAVLAALPAGTPARAVLQALVLNHLYVLWLPGNDFVPVMIYEWRSLTDGNRQQVQDLKDSYELPWRTVLQQLADAGQLGTDPSLTRSMLFGVMHGSLRWFKPQGRLSLEALAQQCVSAMVFPPGTVAHVACETSPPACDTVALVRQAHGLGPVATLAGAAPAESPLAQHLGPQAARKNRPRAARVGALPAKRAPAQAKATRKT